MRLDVLSNWKGREKSVTLSIRLSALGPILFDNENIYLFKINTSQCVS